MINYNYLEELNEAADINDELELEKPEAVNIIIKNIDWETDGYNVTLPDEVNVWSDYLGVDDINNKDKLEDLLSNFLLDEYGFLQNGFDYEIEVEDLRHEEDFDDEEELEPGMVELESLNEDNNSPLVIKSGVLVDCDKLAKNIIIPDSVTSIGEYAFSSCSNLTSVTIPNSVTSIDKYAFSNCDSLTSITIPDSVTSIGVGAFWSCTNLKSINIPDSVTYIGSYALHDCRSLISITIPDSVTGINDNVFNNCTRLTSITIPDSVIEIGKYAFYSCRSLTSINIPDSVIKINKDAFATCSSLETLYIPESVKFISNSTFDYCPNLTIKTNNPYVKRYCKENDIPLDDTYVESESKKTSLNNLDETIAFPSNVFKTKILKQMDQKEKLKAIKIFKQKHPYFDLANILLKEFEDGILKGENELKWEDLTIKIADNNKEGMMYIKDKEWGSGNIKGLLQTLADWMMNDSEKEIFQPKNDKAIALENTIDKVENMRDNEDFTKIYKFVETNFPNTKDAIALIVYDRAIKDKGKKIAYILRNIQW